MTRRWGIAAAVFILSPPVGADGLLQGIQKLACEAILCLSTADRPSACRPSIRKYYAIDKDDWAATYRARRDFLRQCPSANEAAPMRRLTDAIAKGAEVCQRDGLLRRLNAWEDPRCHEEQAQGVVLADCRGMTPTIPQACRAYYGHPYTDLGPLPIRERHCKRVRDPDPPYAWHNQCDDRWRFPHAPAT